MNRLAEATSPYLRMHADNPIDWREWGEEALAEARSSDRPILLSVGYAACHWCHVMAHESFSDPAIAELVNPNFVAIKVDREERPDLDAVFMKATQALTGSGGWPMTVFLTPDGLPFFAGTYYPPVRTAGMPSFAEVVSAIDTAWRQRRDEADASAAAIAAHLADAFVPMAAAGAGRVDLWEAMEELSAEFDPIHGGFGTAPKFPAPLLVDALGVKGEPGSLDVAQRTLDAMARGGIHDQVGGGFARYSVDAAWVVPHFEKMLYDNALLLGSYTRGWRRVPDHDPLLRAQFERVVRGIVGWLERELLLPSGGFASSLDADSLDSRGMQHEGIYYCWTPELLTDALGEDGAWATEVFHVTTTGTFEHGLSTLQLRGNPETARLAEVSAKLLTERQLRFAPARDDKVVASWNGWAIDSLVWAAAVFGEPAWLELARGAAECLWRDHWDGRLRRSSLAGQASAVAGFAEDYGAVALGFARLAGAVGDAEWLRRAQTLLAQAVEVFGAVDGGFHDAAGDAEQLFARARDLSDNPTPSGTSSLIAALRLVGLLADDPALIERADLAAGTLRGLLEQAPRFAGSALVDALVADEARTGLRPAVAVVIGEPLGQDARATWRIAPIGTAVVTGPAGTPGFAHHFEDRAEPGVYVCRGTTCFPPTSDLTALRTALWSRVS